MCGHKALTILVDPWITFGGFIGPLNTGLLQTLALGMDLGHARPYCAELVASQCYWLVIGLTAIGCRS